MTILLVALIASEACPVFSLEMADAMKKQGHDVYAIIPEKVVNYSKWKDALGEGKLCVVQNHHDNKAQMAKTILNFIAGHRKQLRIIDGITFDCVIYTFYHRWNMLVKRYISTKRSLIIVHDPVNHSGVSKATDLSASRQFESMDGAIVLTKKFRKIVSERYHIAEKDIYDMPHFILPHSRDKKDKRCEMKESGKINFLFFGRIDPYKGIGILIQAFHELEEALPDIQLTIAGRGDLDEYRQIIDASDRIRTDIRFIPDEEVDDYYLEPNTVLVLPYLDATQSGVLSIAFEHGNPVIASDTGGLREQLDEGRIGLFFKPGDVNGLKDAMGRLAGNMEMMKQESRKMTEFAKRLSSDEAIRILMDQMH